MEGADAAVEHFEIAAAKAGNHTHTTDYIDWLVSQIDYSCQWQFVNIFPMILNCLQGVVEREMGHPEKP
jgi:hypothetical protein